MEEGSLRPQVGQAPAGAGHQALQIAQRGEQAQAGASAFGSRRCRVRKPCARETSVTWCCQPRNERPSKWRTSQGHRDAARGDLNDRGTAFERRVAVLWPAVLCNVPRVTPIASARTLAFARQVPIPSAASDEASFPTRGTRILFRYVTLRDARRSWWPLRDCLRQR